MRLEAFSVLLLSDFDLSYRYDGHLVEGTKLLEVWPQGFGITFK